MRVAGEGLICANVAAGRREGCPALLHNHEAAIARDLDPDLAALVGARFAGADEGRGRGFARLQRKRSLLAVQFAGCLGGGRIDSIRV